MKKILFLLFCLPSFLSAQDLPKGFKRNPVGKGMVLASTTFSVSHKQSEQEQTLVQLLNDSYKVDWEVTLRSGYYIKDGFAVGGYFLVGQERNERSYYQDGFLVTNKTQNNRYGIAPFIRNYYPLGKGQFMLFNQTSLEFIYTNGLNQIVDAEDLKRLTSEGYKLTLGLQPGIAVFLSDKISFDIGTSILGVTTDYTKSQSNNDPNTDSYVWKNDVSFDIDLLSLFLGITFYIPT
jgi:hypothetical protein